MTRGGGGLAMDVTYDSKIVDAPGAWGAVFSMALCAAVLIASEFMPVSLLSPIATGLEISEGRTGQAISVSGLFAVLMSLSVPSLIRRFDRRVVVLALTALLTVSGTVFAIAPNHEVLMLGRALLGIAIGGFWSMSIAIVMRLVPAESIPGALAMINAGAAVAATVSAPLGSLLGDYVGWRAAFFFLIVPMALLALVWQWMSLPSLPPRTTEGSANVFRLLSRRDVVFGMGAILLFFMGQRALFTYIRPFLETVAEVDVPTLSLILLLMGLAGVGGTYLVGRLLRTRLFGVNIAIPLAMGVLTAPLIALGSVPLIAALLLIAWASLGTAAPIGWGTWVARALPNDAEAGGGLQVATIQLGATLGAAGSGILFDAFGWWSSFAFSAALLCGSSLLVVAAWRAHHRGMDDRGAVKVLQP